MKEHKFPYESFIGGWYIDPKICDGIIDVFKENPQEQRPGVIGGPFSVNKKSKDSIDIGVDPHWKEPRYWAWKQALKECCTLYEEKYPELSHFKPWGLVEGVNIQYYPPGGGYFVPHFERGSIHENRNLVFMTYLNDVPEGGTHFKYQKLTTPAKKGLTLIWPTDFTHTHSGQITKEHEKYIITGWFGFLK